MPTIQSRYKHSEKVHNLISPSIIVPYICDHLPHESVVDIGCGIGTFLKAFKNQGVKKVLGVDGDWVKVEQLQIKEEEFLRANLEIPLSIMDKFDLVLCLEVAEHLSTYASDTLVETLTSLGNIIVFSSAIPYQGGQNHVNEQDYAYWQDKFSKKGYYYYDFFRNQFWNHNSVDWWYKQNMFLVVHESIILDESINKCKVVNSANVYVHPEKVKILFESAENIRTGSFPVSDYLAGLFSKVRRVLNAKIL
jgi:SAM-dependent methyltransferase